VSRWGGDPLDIGQGGGAESLRALLVPVHEVLCLSQGESPGRDPLIIGRGGAESLIALDVPLQVLAAVPDTVIVSDDGDNGDDGEGDQDSNDNGEDSNDSEDEDVGDPVRGTPATATDFLYVYASSSNLLRIWNCMEYDLSYISARSGAPAGHGHGRCRHAAAGPAGHGRPRRPAAAEQGRARE